jgi:hypothetical protein
MHCIERHSYAFQSILDSHQGVSLLCIRIEFSLQIFEKKSQISIFFFKIRPLGAELFHTDRRTLRS